MDDIWSMDAWHSLKPAFPIAKKGIKILLTTRNQKLASKIHPCHFLHELRYLNKKESWDLFEKKALLRRDGTGKLTKFQLNRENNEFFVAFYLERKST